jgi:hypothetical protein
MSNSQKDDGFPLQGLTTIILHAGLLLRHAFILLAAQAHAGDRHFLPNIMASPMSATEASAESMTVTTAVSAGTTIRTTDDVPKTSDRAQPTINTVIINTFQNILEAQDVTESKVIPAEAPTIIDITVPDRD